MFQFNFSSYCSSTQKGKSLGEGEHFSYKLSYKELIILQFSFPP